LRNVVGALVPQIGQLRSKWRCLWAVRRGPGSHWGSGMVHCGCSQCTFGGLVGLFFGLQGYAMCVRSRDRILALFRLLLSGSGTGIPCLCSLTHVSDTSVCLVRSSSGCLSGPHRVVCPHWILRFYWRAQFHNRFHTNLCERRCRRFLYGHVGSSALELGRQRSDWLVRFHTASSREYNVKAAASVSFTQLRHPPCSDAPPPATI